MTYVAPSEAALELLDALEMEQAKLLCWGVPEATFRYEEIVSCAETVMQARGANITEESVWLLVKTLTDTGWLWELPDSKPQLFRTRLGESVRLFSQLRQMFAPWPGSRSEQVDWRGAPRLVADYRLMLRRRVFPRRSLEAEQVLAQVADVSPNPLVGRLVIDALLREGTAQARKLAGFQVRGTRQVLDALRDRRSAGGTIVCAGTGSGKTLSFYLPALIAIASQEGSTAWTKCLALYPRNELLKDQLREALGNITAVNPGLRKADRRPLSVGALFGETPRGTWEVTKEGKGWRKLRRGTEGGFVCPLARCPHCSADLLWLEKDLRKKIERLVCSATTCSFATTKGDVSLTREQMLRQPPDVLFTTTEMLNRRLGSKQFQPLLGIGCRAAHRPFLVLLDEVHTNEGIHGAHVAMLLRRWRHLSEARPHMVGLSATLEDAPRFFAELTGLPRSSVAEVSPLPEELESQGCEYLLALRGEPSSQASLLSTSIQTLMLLRRVIGADPKDSVAGSRVFAFTDNLDVVNRLFHNLRDAEGWTAGGKQKANAQPLANLRSSKRGTLAEQRERLSAGQNWELVESLGHSLVRPCQVGVERTTSQDPGVQATAAVVVATASLEVGFDDPSVGAVLQHKAPKSAAGFLQRKGRAGRQREMRPWTVVVLSDYGRDRAAYQSYEQMFAPTLTPRYLPLANRAMLRMQATYALFEWLGSDVPRAEPWSDLAAPPNKDLPKHEELRERQLIYKDKLKELMTHPAKQRAFSNYVAAALGLDRDNDVSTIEALLWQPPRPVLMGAVPTLVRRLERAWTSAFNPDRPESHFRYGSPLPEFVQQTLFGDLLVPEVQILTGVDDPPTMLVAQALREFAPGRISRRFGIEGKDSHWVDPGESHTFQVAQCCPEGARDYLGRFEYGSKEGTKQVLVYRPRGLHVTKPPETLLPSSNAFPEWKAQIVATDAPHQVDLPSGSPWQEIVHALRFHMHQAGSPIELRRFTPSCHVSLVRPRSRPEEREVYFVSDEGGDAAALGFVADVDAIEVRFVYPPSLLASCAAARTLLRALRATRFHDLVRCDTQLDGVVNRFQRDWVADAYLAALTSLAIERSLSPEEASAVLVGNPKLIIEALERLFQWASPAHEGDGEDEDEEPGEHDADDPDRPKRLKELIAALGDAGVRTTLHKASPSLWQSPDETWLPWLKARYRATLAAAMLEAFSMLCPQLDTSIVLEDLEVHPTLSEGMGEDRFWLTETAIGGGGAIEAFFRAYADDPRRYFRLLQSALEPSSMERMAGQLEQVVALAAGPEDGPMPSAFAAMRAAQGHQQTLVAVDGLRRVCASVGVQADPSLFVALSARLLRPGTRREVDLFVADALRAWCSTEERLGLDVDIRVWCSCLSRDGRLEAALGVVPMGMTSAGALTAWRYSQLRSLLWSRGGSLRSEALRSGNFFEQAPMCDRLLVVETMPRRAERVRLEGEDWFDAVAEALSSAGVVELAVRADGSGRLAAAMRQVATRPVDTGALLVHAHLVGVRREPSEWVATFELPEAFQ